MENSEIKKLALKYALQNAVRHRNPPQAGAVMGKLMTQPELRSRAREVLPLVEEVLAEVESMPSDGWEEALKKLAPELASELKAKKQPQVGLTPLPIEGGGVVMRFAPNPNGPPTLGSARGIVVNSEYARRYQGEFIMRFDDTDPQNKPPLLEAYDWYLDDARWLGASPDRVVVASGRLEVYYGYAVRLLEMGHAYVCQCPQAVFKEYRDSGRACPHRSQPVEESLEGWEKMLDGGYRQGEAVVRIKTDIRHPDPAIRDWVAMRITETPHPRVGDRYRVWPMLDFESAIEDHLQGVTHILRGKDLRDSTRRQEYIYRYLGWEYPFVLHWGRMKIHEYGRLSTSTIAREIQAGVYTGWDDPRLPTIRALRRRGIKPEAVRSFLLNLGVGETDISLSLETLYAENRKLVDPQANRYFFTPEPVEMEIQGVSPRVSRPPLHPNQPERGCREIHVKSKVLLSGGDVTRLEPGSRLRLKDLYNIEVTSLRPLQARYTGDGLEEVKKEKLPIVHWTPPDGVRVRVLTPEKTREGIGEPGIKNEVGRVVQFERFGFVNIDRLEGGVVIAYFTHK